MTTGTPDSAEAAGLRRAHWETLYQNRGFEQVSWYQPQPTVSLRLIDELGISPDRSVIDVGGGASSLVDSLVERGFKDVSVLDVSGSALAAARDRLGSAASVEWLENDLLAWEPSRRYDVWHDRAVLHFLTAQSERERYLDIMKAALSPGGHIILATFASDGPDRCSNLPVSRYDAEDLAGLLTGFELVTTTREEHVTPAGVVQPFTWVAAKRGE